MIRPGRAELRELPLPAVGPDDGLLKIEACGVAEGDPSLFRRSDVAPLIPGHEIVGVVARIGALAAARWRVREGDRVALQEYIPCGACAWCSKGDYRLCPQAQAGAPDARRYGLTGTEVAPGLWGGFADHLYLHPRSVLHPIAGSVAASRATLVLPFANAFQAIREEAALQRGETALVFGNSVAAFTALAVAKVEGAGRVCVGIASRHDAHRAAAMQMGAEVLSVDGTDFVERVLDATKGEGAHVVIDASSDTSGRVAAAAIASAATGARLVLGGVGTVPLHMGEIRRKYLSLRPVRGHATRAVEAAIAHLEARNDLPALLEGSLFSLAEAETALHAGETDVSAPLRAVIRP
jgi:threonine dehydrogenase-like Zn-dependent dehydrogenase